MRSDGESLDHRAVDYAALWTLEFPALSRPDVSVALCPVPKNQMIDFPMHSASPTTINPISATIPSPSQLSEVKNMLVPQYRLW